MFMKGTEFIHGQGRELLKSLLARVEVTILCIKIVFECVLGELSGKFNQPVSTMS